MQPNPVIWFEIYVSNLERARRFYETVFQVQLNKLDTPAPDIEMLSFPMQKHAAGAAGALCKMPGYHPGMGTVVYFACEDCAVEEARVQRAGGHVIRPKMSIGQYGAISLVVDTEGNMIGLHSMK
ncbi:MAG: VOC family protein [Gammaproteobacteria bacterium]|nr:lactoylglutathione lyase [Gammaproteobacteria bacterium]